jgi:hypothetical protein
LSGDSRPARFLIALPTVHRRRSNSSVPLPDGAVHGTRRVGGQRREASERVELRSRLTPKEASGWTLNISRGGARLVLEETVELGEIYDLTLGEQDPREVRIVWLQEESDGQIAGVQFLDTDGSVPPPPSAPSQGAPPASDAKPAGDPEKS